MLRSSWEGILVQLFHRLLLVETNQFNYFLFHLRNYCFLFVFLVGAWTRGFVPLKNKFASLVRRRLVLVIEGDCICILVQLSMENFFLVETIFVLCPKCLMPCLQGDGLIDALEFWWTSLRTSSYLRIPWASTRVKKEPTLPCWDRYRIDKTFALFVQKFMYIIA